MKRTPRPDLTAAEAARVGEDLREARLTLGASVEDMAERLRINRRYIHALEEGRIKDLPGPAYAVGFVRSYAAALGLDPDEAVRRFRDVTGGAATKNGELVFPEPVPSRGVPAGALVAVGAVLAVGAYVAWYNWSGSGSRVVDAVPPVPARLDPAVPEAQRPRETAAPGTPGAPTQAAAAPAGPAASVAPAAQPAPAPAAAPVPPGMAGVVLRARGETWVQVRDSRQNQTVLDRVLRAGDTYQVPPRDGMVLTTGKAENLDVLLDGQVVAVLVGATGVRRGLALDTERLRAAGPAAAATTPAAPAAGPAAAAPQLRPATPDAAPRPAPQGARP
ncbi:helix-turn-helix domain-containing protein [Roseomonas sp. JC162]|uniref:Helix-turn-helix domain-containing protein n=1 Tax=Neoroseomonas marina TaxID=1232220 RepID=A0A848ELK7_9PROT|nr:helix-turn-helix domain-containing protein [Neoroseomonas marina]NMJ44228.1 helix-turn-helix domain-containing protein [Neoroseomonas marina]